MMRKDPQLLIDEFGSAHPNALRLAEVVSVAVRVESELLRMARLTLVPEANAGDEADLWFSPLVQVRNVLGFVFYPDIVQILRKRLASQTRLLDDTWNKVFTKVHGSISPALFVEEEVTWRALKDPNDPEIENLLRGTLSALVHDDKQNGVSHWVLRALPTLPDSVRQLEIIPMLEWGACLRLGYAATFSNIQESEISKSMPDWAYKLLPSDLGTVKIEVRFVEGGIEFGDLDSFKDAQTLELPATNPLQIDVSWKGKSGQEETRVVWLKHDKQIIQHVDTDEVELKTLSRDRYKLYKSQRVEDELGTIKSETNVQMLINTLKDENKSVLEIVTKALENIKSETDVQLIINVLKDEDEFVLKSVAEVLGNLNFETAVKPLINTLNKWIYEKELEMKEKLLKNDPENVAYQSDVATTLNNMGSYDSWLKSRGNKRIWRKGMSVLIATVGGTESIVQLGFRMVNVGKVILVPGKSFEQVMEKSEIKQGIPRVDPVRKAYELTTLLENFGVDVEIYEVNPLNFKECLIRIIELIQAQPKGTEITVNVTGGTKLLSLAAMNAACMCCCKAFYVLEKGSGDIKVDLPSPNFGYCNNIGEVTKKILLYLLEEQKKLNKHVEEYNDDELKNFITREIAHGLGVTPQTITNKLQMMEADGLLKSKKSAIKKSSGLGKSSVQIWWLTDEGRIYATYFSKKNS
jgi:hypothetical protein